MISYFEYNGQKSSDFGIKIYNDLEFSTARRDIEEIKVLGRDGVLLYDNERLDIVEKTINFDITNITGVKNGSDGSQLFNRVLEISKWLNVKGFHDFKYSMYPNFTFKATIIDTYNIRDTIRTFGRGSIKIKFQPYMYYNSGLDERIITTKTTLKNKGIISMPRLRITPLKTGQDIEIKNNGKLWLKLKGLEHEIIIDSELMQAYDKLGNANEKMYINRPLFPQLEIGNNLIEYNSELCTVNIIPRFREEII
ncbi:hypothetical protein [Helcococcus kunzii]|uniref:hypothetical protein n=1 Tax=Helcococcus kunzii TaxID=40091 RepID=UPI0038A4C83F